jgi:uncharacterized protein (TIGR00290 family)
MTEKALFAWSGGKDSALALYKLKNYEISALLTTVLKDYDRTSMHSIRRILLEQQVYSMGYPLEQVSFSKSSSNDEYATKMQEILSRYQKRGVSSVIFGDIFLKEVRNYRENNLLKIGMKGIFPLWKRDTAELAHTFLDLGFKAIITSVDSKVLDKDFAGRFFDERFLSELPSSVDPCGENGEFHSFVYDGPIFQKRILYTIGDVALRDNGYYYCDLIPF